MYAGLTGGFMFIIIQILLIIDFAHSWSTSWAERVDVGNASFWYTALAFSTILIYSVAITMAVLFYLFFTDVRDPTKCRGNMFFITFNLSHCILATVISVLPQVQDEASGSGLLQSSVVTLYAMYLTWCTLSSEPNASCNPLGDVILEYDKASGVNGQALFDCVLMFALLIFACNVRAGTSKLEHLGFSLSKLSTAPKKCDYVDDFDAASSANDARAKNVNGDEFVEYNYSFFHVVMVLASLQLMMVVTNWHSPNETADMKKLVKNWATVWIQLSASFLCVLFYIWAMVMPLLVKTWGSCLGLDYERVPTEDEECGRRRRRHDAMYARGDVMCARDDAREEFDARSNFRTKADKTRQSTMDSGMFDTNASRSYSRSVSRASVRGLSSKTSNSEDFGHKGVRPSEDAGDTVLDNASMSLDQKDVNEELREEMVEKLRSVKQAVKATTEEKLEGLQSREPAVTTISNNAGISSESQSRLANIEEINEIVDTSKGQTETQGRKSEMEIDVNIGNLSRNESRHSRPSSRNVVNNRTLSSNEENPNPLPRAHGRLSVISSDEEREYPRESSRCNPRDRSLPSEGENINERPRKKSSEIKNDSFGTLSDVSATGRPPSRSIGGDRSKSSVERNKHSRPYSKASERCQSKLSDRVVSARPTSSLARLISSDERNRHSRSCSRASRTSQLKLLNVQTDSRRSSSETLVNDRNAVGNNPITPDKGRSVLLEMRQHIEWFKRLRKSRNVAENATGKNVSENKQKSEENNVKTPQDSLLNKKEKNTREGDDLNENGSSKHTKISTERESSESKEKVNYEKTSKSVETISVVENRNKNGKTEEKRDSAIYKHPFAAGHVSAVSKKEPQAPDVSREILRVQAKILRFQAKVVKTQQKILEIQDQEEAGQRTQLPSENSA